MAPGDGVSAAFSEDDWIIGFRLADQGSVPADPALFFASLEWGTFEMICPPFLSSAMM